jgi:cell division protein FtsX
MRNTYLIIAITVIISLLAACTSEEENLQKYITLKEAQINHEVAMDEMIHTEESETYAVTMYETEEGIGVIEFWKDENGWGSSSSGFNYFNNELPITDSAMISGGETTISVLYGQINDENIHKVIAKKAGKEIVPKLIQGKLGTYWLYTIDEMITIDKESDQIKGLDKDGNVIYEK